MLPHESTLNLGRPRLDVVMVDTPITNLSKLKEELVALLDQHERETNRFAGSVKTMMIELLRQSDNMSLYGDPTPTIQNQRPDLFGLYDSSPTDTPCRSVKHGTDLEVDDLQNVPSSNTLCTELERQTGSDFALSEACVSEQPSQPIVHDRVAMDLPGALQLVDDNDVNDECKDKPRDIVSSSAISSLPGRKPPGTHPDIEHGASDVLVRSSSMVRTPTHPSSRNLRKSQEPGWKQTEDAISKSIQQVGDLMDLSVMKHRALEVVIPISIVLNAGFVGWRVQDQAVTGELSTFAAVGECYFCIIFSADLIYRLRVEGCRHFFMGCERSWNWFDAAVVSTSIFDVIMGLAFDVISSPLSSMSAMRSVRLLRLLRVVRVGRLAKQMHEMRLLVFTIAKALRGCTAVASVITLLVYCFGIFFTEAAFEHCRENANKGDALCRMFGKLDLSVRSLYESVLGGILWGEALDALQPLNFFYKVVFVGYISFSILIVLNITTSLFSELEHETFKKERDSTLVDKEVKDRELCIKRLYHLFQEFDVNKSGDISYDQFAEGLKNPEMLALLQALKLDVYDIRSVFNLLDTDGSGVIEMREFVCGCMRLKGNAKNNDIQDLKASVAAIKNSISELLRLRSEDVQLRSEDVATRTCIGGKGIDSTRQQKPVAVAKSVGRKRRAVTFQGKIAHAENRAMLLRELLNVTRKINSECGIEMWQDMRTGLVLQPADVTLYSFNHHYILPNSLLGPVTLIGLPDRIAAKGLKVTLDKVHGKDALPLAEGLVEDVLSNGAVRVTTTRGRFRNEDGCCISIGERSVDSTLLRFERPDNCSYKELISQQSCAPQWYCCHWWGEKVFDFVACVGHHARMRALADDSSYWVCAYANRQHELDLDIGVDLEASSFFVALKRVQGVLLVLDREATPFRRIWCDFEIYSSISNDDIILDMITLDESDTPQFISEGLLPHETSYQKALREQHFPARILLQGMRLQLQDGASTVAADKERILHNMVGATPSDSNYASALEIVVQRANTALHGVFALAAWPMALKCGRVPDFDEEDRGQVSLPEVLKRDTSRHQLKLNLSHSSALYDPDIFNVVECLTPNLRELDLSFEESPNITDDGIVEIARRMPQQLRVLLLDLSSCKEISDRSITALAESLPKSLVHLELDFANCPLLTSVGIKELSKSIPETLTTFKGSFRGTVTDTFFDSPEKIKKFKFGRTSVLGKVGLTIRGHKIARIID